MGFQAHGISIKASYSQVELDFCLFSPKFLAYFMIFQIRHTFHFEQTQFFLQLFQTGVHLWVDLTLVCHELEEKGVSI